MKKEERRANHDERAILNDREIESAIRAERADGRTIAFANGLLRRPARRASAFISQVRRPGGSAGRRRDDERRWAD